MSDLDLTGLTDSQLRLFAVRCVRRVQHLMRDPSSIKALDVAERHARGQATDEELKAACDAAWAAARAAAGYAAESVAKVAAAWAAKAAASAAGVAALAALAARAAADAAAARAAAADAADAAREAERAAQREILEQIRKEGRE